MREAEIREVKAIREQMVPVLQHVGPGGCKQADLARAVRNDPTIAANHTEDRVYYLVGLAVRLYRFEFYRDRSTGRIFLGGRYRRFLELEALAQPATGRTYGTTACAITHDAMET